MLNIVNEMNSHFTWNWASSFHLPSSQFFPCGFNYIFPLPSLSCK